MKRSVKSNGGEIGRNSRRTFLKSAPVPLLWYLLITLVVPLLNGAHQRYGGRFWEHAGFVLVVPIVVLFFMFVARRVFILMRSKF